MFRTLLVVEAAVLFLVAHTCSAQKCFSVDNCVGGSYDKCKALERTIDCPSGSCSSSSVTGTITLLGEVTPSALSVLSDMQDFVLAVV